MLSGVDRTAGRGRSILLPFVLVSFAANSVITRHVVGSGLLDPGLLSAVRFVCGAIALVVVSLLKRERVVVGRPNALPALWLGVYAGTISYGYQHIGAAAGTFVFYAAVLVTLTANDLVQRIAVPGRRALGAAVALAGVGVLAAGSDASTGSGSVLGVALLAVTGVAWGRYTIAGRAVADPRSATTGHFVVVAAVTALPLSAGAAAGLHVTGLGLAWAAAMGVGTTALAYVAWYTCQRRLTGTAAGSVQLVIPVLAAVGAVLVLGERVSSALFLASVLVGAGMWLARPPRIDAAVAQAR